ncbi:MAG: hypothetical protein JNK05_24125 [Myxococcales bacterium]|nr:hypothetical protein [Myxococcales bacterium]
MSAESPQMKGAMLAEFLRWYSAHHDDTPVRVLIESDPEARSLGLDGSRAPFGLVTSEWYPATLFHRILDAGLGRFSSSERHRLMQNAADAVAVTMLRGLYSVLFALVATPDRYSRHIQRAWSQLHDTGTREVLIVRPGEAESIIRAWPAHHPYLCQMVHETTRAVFSHMRVGAVTVERERCIDDGSPECVARVRWTKP